MTAVRVDAVALPQRPLGCGRDRRSRAAAAPPAPLRTRAGGAWALFWDDRRGVYLKLALLAGCILAASLFEVVP